MRINKLIRVAGVLLLMSCGGGGAGTLSGSIGGVSFKPSDAQIFNQETGTTQGKWLIPTLMIQESGGLCGDLQSLSATKAALNLNIALIRSMTATSVADIAIGDYAVSSNQYALSECLGASSCKDFADANFFRWSDNCVGVNPAGTGSMPRATAGTVTVEEVSNARVKGRFDLTFGSDHVTGTFDAPSCSRPTGSPQPTCR